jgi:hypothetical protein
LAYALTLGLAKLELPMQNLSFRQKLLAISLNTNKTKLANRKGSLAFDRGQQTGKN